MIENPYNDSTNSKFLVDNIFALGQSFCISLASSIDKENVRQFVTTIHLRESGYSKDALEQQIIELPIDFPELYDDSTWLTSKCWICRNISNNSIVGVIGVRHISDQILYLSYFFVDENYRSMGIGYKLYNIAIDWAKYCKRNCFFPYDYQEVQLLTLRSIYEKAYEFYLRNGFITIVDEQKEYYHIVEMKLMI